MSEKKTKPLLIPVQRADFSITLGGNAAAINASPDEVFAPLIKQFAKMAVGPHFWIVADVVHGRNHSVGGMIKKMHSIEGELEDISPDIFFKNTHTEDITRLFAFTNHWTNYFSALSAERKKDVRPTIYARMLNIAGNYNWHMVQYIDHIMDEEGKLLYVLTLVTDISHIKKSGVAMMSILDSHDESCQLFFCTDGKTLPDSNTILPKISPRELEVLRLLAAGNSSKQIAAALNTAVKTIDNHRQNLLQKTGTKSSGALVGYAINRGFI